ncbi:hypothetical protein J5X84_16400 [Streptosporangiaceae bacterium NEAU-GS5]|nr:hypothetical protein [Streptosporangiaceae bacterium NEAU-GS5]
MNAKRWVSTTSAAALLASATIMGTATGASAAPTDCTYTVNQSERWATSFCASGTGQHRIHVVQRHFLPEVGLIVITGPWQPAGVTSYTQISPHTLVSAWVDVQG